MKHQTPTVEQPRYIKLNARDNVAIVVNDFGLPAGTKFPCGLELNSLRAAGPQDRAGRYRPKARRSSATAR